METPRSANRAQKAQALSAKLSSRKRALFGKDDANQSDFSQITPIRFSSTKKTSTKPNLALNNITSFRNLFGNESPESDRSLSPDFDQKYRNNGRYELLTAEQDKENQHEVDEETRFSFHSVPETPSGRLSAEESALLDESNSNSLSMLMSSDLNLIEKRCQPMLRTPSLTTRSTAKPTQMKSLEPSLRFTVGTPDANANQADGKELPVNGSNVEARTALYLKDMPTISTKSFYSSIVDRPAKLDPERIAAPIEISPVNHAPKDAPVSTTTKSVSTSKTPRKSTSMRKRTKSFSSSAPRLGQRGVVHKIRKPTKKPSPVTKEAKESKKRVKRIGKQPQKNRAIPGGTKSCPTTPKSSEAKEPKDDELINQLERVKHILLKGQNNLRQARPLSATRSMTDLRKDTLPFGEEADSPSTEDENSASEEEGPQDENRKFFRSRSGSRSHRKVYNHFNSIVLDVRKGGKRKLINFPQTSKRRRTDFANDKFDFITEQLEVDDLISRLDQGSSAIEYHDQQQQEQSYVPVEYEKSVDWDDDEPIPIQSNIIYLTMDEFVVDDTQMDDMEYAESVPSNHTIIVQHNDEHHAQNVDLLTEKIMDDAGDGFSKHDQSHCNAEDTIRTIATGESITEYYPIFYRDRVKELWKQDGLQSKDSTQMDVFHLLRRQDRGIGQKQRHGIGQDQYQLDAGQRAYGAVLCAECGLLYSNNEPEEELIHDNFHRSQTNLKFAGWTSERIVSQVPEWDVTGRIIVVSQADSKQWLAKVQSILEVVDCELGFATHGELPEGASVYLAIARSSVLGVCVVQTLQYANRMISIEGLHGVPIDCYSSEFYPVKCGVSRIWVSPKYRRLGVGRKLIASIKNQHIFGYSMNFEEIAFGAPTETGKLFAESVTGRKDFLVYL